jgi:hypothetical protein
VLGALLFAWFALVAAFVSRLRAPWTRIAVRVAGSWFAAIGILLAGWALRWPGSTATARRVARDRRWHIACWLSMGMVEPAPKTRRGSTLEAARRPTRVLIVQAGV